MAQARCTKCKDWDTIRSTIIVIVIAVNQCYVQMVKQGRSGDRQTSEEVKVGLTAMAYHRKSVPTVNMKGQDAAH
jgi:hypothetical protein